MSIAADFRNRISERELLIVDSFLSEIPVPVGQLAHALGLKVYRAPMEPELSGLIKPSDGGSFEIHVNKYESQERQRFTVAHEIAHFLLHRSLIGEGVRDSVLYRSSLGSRIEAEANRLAADIVMPAFMVRQELSERGGMLGESVVAELADRFRVSEQAMRIRLGV
jgi:hypothetical protein